MTARLVLVLGGTRSGKSRFGLRRAEELAGAAGVTYLATARSGDPELDRRIAGHRARRPPTWPTIDVDDDLAAAIRSADPDAIILLDGLTLWLSGLGDERYADPDRVLDGPLAAALDAIAERPGAVVIVSDEVGLGIVPMDAATRAFRDTLGLIHQRLAEDADEVHLLVAGLPLTLKPR